MGEMLWAAMNFGTSVFLISGAVVAIQGPIKSIMLSQMQHSKWLPPMADGKVGLLATARTLYRGSGAGMAGSSARTAYVTTSKSTMEGVEVPTEEIVERIDTTHPRSFMSEMGRVMAFSLGDVGITQVPESLSQLKKLNIISSTFNWKTKHNAQKLFTVGFASRSVSSLVNFTSICMLEGAYAQALPIQADSARHFAAGALSGMSAGIVSFPFAYYKDYALGQAKVVDGHLYTLSFRDFYAQTSNYMTEKGGSAVVKHAWKLFCKQAPMRLALSTAIFSVIAGVGECVGEEPLSKLVEKAPLLCKKGGHLFGFFAGQAKASGAVMLNEQCKTQDKVSSSPA